MKFRFLPRRFAPGLLLGLLFVALAASGAGAQEKKISLAFNKELLYNIARDNEGQMTEEIVNRLLGLSPAVADVEIIRSGGDVILTYTVRAADNLSVQFRLIVEKLAFYRMAAAREDVAGMLDILRPVQAKEQLITDLAYRYDDRYSIIDITLDLGPAIRLREQEQMKKAATALAPKKPPPPKRELKSSPPKKEPPVKKSAEKAPADKRVAAKKKPPPEPKAEKKPPAPPPPKKPAYLAAAALTKIAPPEVDGRGTDNAWKQAEPFSFGVEGKSGTFHVTVSALWGKGHIYFLLSWPDKSADREHRPWVWSEEEAYLAGKAVEDALALQFSRQGKISDCMLSGRAVEADLWFWRAARTNPVGFAEDGTMKVSLERIPKANSYAAKNRRTVWIKESRDEGAGPYRSQVAGTFAGEKVDRYVPQEPSGSSADIRAKATWSGGTWTLELSRRLETGDAGDVSFRKGVDHYFSMAVYNGRERGEHSTSREHLLKLE